MTNSSYISQLKENIFVVADNKSSLLYYEAAHRREHFLVLKYFIHFYA